MDSSLKYNRQMRSLSIAMATAICAAVGAMFVPVAAYEMITGATGVSELVPATAAPLGDTARALIAFGASALTLAVMTVILLGTDKKPHARTNHEVLEADLFEDDHDLRPSVLDRIAQFKLPTIAAPKWPWQKDEDDITEFADLPKLRGNDVHPDAPPRRPLSATSDLPVLELVEPQTRASIAEKTVAPPSTGLLKALSPDQSPAFGPTSEIDQPMIADMVVQLEAAVAERQRQLKELEAVAARLSTSQSFEEANFEVPEGPLPEPVRPTRLTLDAVPAVVEKQDDMDEALTAALATLHRMNGTNR